MGRYGQSIFALLIVVAMWGGCKAGEPLRPSPSEGRKTPAVMPAYVVVPLPSGWRHVDTKQGFGFDAPERTVSHRLQGTDSAVGEIRGPGFGISYDFGFYSNPLEGMREAADYSEDHITVDGREAIVRRAFWREGKVGQRYSTGLYVAKVELSTLFRPSGNWIALEIDGTAATEADRKIVERIFTTIRFDHPATTQP